jgi:competence ComEA-like helix-hairpin-helix protein
MAEQRINVNTATAEELTRLPGIGPTLAQRIVTYRDTVRLFEEPSQITAVSGIGDQTYRAMAERLAVAAPEELSGLESEPSQEGVGEVVEGPTEPAAEEKTRAEAEAPSEAGITPEEQVEPEVKGLLSGEAMLEEEGAGAEEAPAEAQEMFAEEEAPPEVEEETAPELEEEAALELEEEAAPEVEEETVLELEEGAVPEVAEEAALELEEEAAPEIEEEAAKEPLDTEAVPSETQPPPARVEERPERARSRSWWRRLSWLWTALLGGLLGMAFALVVFSGVNGSLDVAHSRAVIDVRGRMGSLATDVNSLQGDVEGLQKRLDALEELTVRMDRIEGAVGDLQETTTDLGERADALEQRIAAVVQDLETVSEQVATLEDQAEQTRGFFRGLQVLLSDVFGAVEGESMVTPTPTPEGK